MTNLVTRTVNISHEDILTGRHYQACECPGALAIARVFPEVGSVHVTYDCLTVFAPDSDSVWVEYPLPSALEKFALAFDSTHPFYMRRNPIPGPVSFELTLELPQ